MQDKIRYFPLIQSGLFYVSWFRLHYNKHAHILHSTCTQSSSFYMGWSYQLFISKFLVIFLFIKRMSLKIVIIFFHQLSCRATITPHNYHAAQLSCSTIITQHNYHAVQFMIQNKQWTDATGLKFRWMQSALMQLIGTANSKWLQWTVSVFCIRRFVWTRMKNIGWTIRSCA